MIGMPKPIMRQEVAIITTPTVARIAPDEGFVPEGVEAKDSPLWHFNKGFVEAGNYKERREALSGIYETISFSQMPIRVHGCSRIGFT